MANFESLMSSFPRRIIFMTKGSDVTGILLRVNANRTFSDYDAVSEYYEDIKKFHAATFQGAPKGFNTGWFISVGFALYDLQYQLITGTYSSLVASMAIALVILLLTSGNVIVSILAIITISFSIADTIAFFVLLGWNLSILESVVIIMSVGLSVDFSCHYGVAYINADVMSLKENTLNLLFEANTTNMHECENNKQTTVKKSSPAPASDKKTSSKNSSTCKLSTFLKQCKNTYRRNDEERFVRVEEIFR